MKFRTPGRARKYEKYRKIQTWPENDHFHIFSVFFFGARPGVGDFLYFFCISVLEGFFSSIPGSRNHNASELRITNMNHKNGTTKEADHARQTGPIAFQGVLGGAVTPWSTGFNGLVLSLSVSLSLSLCLSLVSGATTLCCHCVNAHGAICSA